MSAKSSLVAGFLSALIAITTLSSGARAQGTVNRIVSCIENEVNHSLILHTAVSVPIAAPQIQYLPGVDGRTVMVADFYGLSWIEPAKIIRPTENLSAPSIEEVRIGQFQANPPICRVALTCKSPACLKDVSFSGKPGQLVVKWGGHPLAQERARPGVRTAVGASAMGEGLHQMRTTLQAAPPRATDDLHQLPSARPATAPDLVAQADLAAEGGAKETAKLPTPASKAIPAPAPDMVASGDQRVDDLINTVRRSSLKSDTGTPKQVLPARQRANLFYRSGLPAAPEQALTRRPGLAAHSAAGQTMSQVPQPLNAPPLVGPKPLNAPDVTMRTRWDNSAAAEVVDSIDSGDIPRTTPDRERTRVERERSNADREREADDASLPGPPMARLTIISGKNANDPQTTIQILTEKHITFKSFRLHNPERHVIDLEKPEEFDEATVSAFESNPFLKTVRIGLPDKRTCRIVLDLADENIGVAERSYLGDDKLLTITLAPQAAQTQTNTSVKGGTTIVLDAGHGGTDPGAQRGDAQEKEMTLAIVKQLQKRLEVGGLHVIMTRCDDTFVSLEDRVKLTNNVMPSAFVSVHINALESTSAIHGIETYFQTEQSKPLAETIHANLVNLLGVPDRGIRKARFYVINHTPVPAILAEVGFISNKDEREKLISSEYQGKVADALAQGVMLYLGKGCVAQTTAIQSLTTAIHTPITNSDRKPVRKGTTAKGNKSVASSN